MINDDDDDVVVVGRMKQEDDGVVANLDSNESPLVNSKDAKGKNHTVLG